jgi:hypothetical protein
VTRLENPPITLVVSLAMTALLLATTTSPDFGREPPREVRLVQEHAVYAAMVETMDTAVGSLLARIDELGLRENTLVGLRRRHLYRPFR